MAPNEDPPPDPREETALATAFGRAVKVIRTGLDLGRRELAARAGLSYSYLAEIESGKKQASASAQQALARALGMSVSELLAAAEEWAERMADGPIPARPPSAINQASLFALARDVRAPLGARERQLRWFRDSAATRVWDRSTVAKRIADAEKKPRKSARAARSARDRGTARDAHLETVIEEMRRLFRGLSEEDRERVLDLAERLAKE